MFGDEAGRARRKYQNAVGESHRLFDIVGDEQDAAPFRFPDTQQLAAHRRLGLKIERAERLVHQHHRGLVGEHAAQRNTMPHAAGELRRIGVVKLGKPQHGQQLGDARWPLCGRDARELKTDLDILAYIEPWQQRVPLEHEADMFGSAVDASAIDRNDPAFDRVETGNGAQDRGLAGTARSHQSDELGLVHRETDTVDDRQTAARRRISERHVVEKDARGFGCVRHFVASLQWSTLRSI